LGAAPAALFFALAPGARRKVVMILSPHGFRYKALWSAGTSGGGIACFSRAIAAAARGRSAAEIDWRSGNWSRQKEDRTAIRESPPGQAPEGDALGTRRSLYRGKKNGLLARPSGERLTGSPQVAWPHGPALRAN